MQEAVPVGQGAMAAIVGLDEAKVLAICNEAAQGEALQPANYNSPGQIVIAGSLQAVQRAIVLAQAHKAKIAKMLAMSVPSHCALMKNAALRLQEKLQQLPMNAPQIPVINNADVLTQTEPAKIKDALVRQLYSPVRWVEIINMMKNYGIEGIFECGPGKVLNGLNKRIADGIVFDILGIPANLQNTLNLTRED
jgi:[acyl-carrier-protein] S-malonyltransferase